MTLQRLATILGIAVAAITVISATWATLAFTGLRPVVSAEFEPLAQDVAILKQQRDEDRWFTLDRKRQSTVGLTDDERREWCVLGIRLKFIQSC